MCDVSSLREIPHLRKHVEMFRLAVFAPVNLDHSIWPWRCLEAMAQPALRHLVEEGGAGARAWLRQRSETQLPRGARAARGTHQPIDMTMA